MAAGWRGRAAAMLMVPALGLAGCEDAPAPAAVPVPAPAASAARPAAPGGIVLTPQPDGGAGPGPQGGVVLANDPSAPADTPLCGGGARERNAIGQSLLPRQYAEAGVCSGFACYDPATATYIGIDGYRHVCR